MISIALRYDFRAQKAGTPRGTLWSEGFAQLAWADSIGFDRVLIPEHHGSEDGYLPSPLVFAAAVAAKTRSIRMQTFALVLPLHDPVRIAEDAAVVDLISQGRLELVVGTGYRPEEYAMFGRTLTGRVKVIEESIAVLRKAWTGEPFEWRGTQVRVTPTPVQQPGPPIFLGGVSEPAARRAARIADGFVPMVEGVYESYRDECIKLGRDPGPPGAPLGPVGVFVSEDPDKTWRMVAPHIAYELNSYRSWLASSRGEEARPITDLERLRQSDHYVVVTPDECLALAEKLGPHGRLTFHPLVGGLNPEVGWESLHLFADKVMPRLKTVFEHLP